MRKCFRFFHPIVIMIMLVIVAGGIAVAQEDITAVDDSGFENRIYPDAVFNHEEHNEAAGLDCAVCHHVYEDGELLEDETSEDSECSECHGNTDDPRNRDLVDRYHQRCKGCHEQEGSGPVVCSACHVGAQEDIKVVNDSGFTNRIRSDAKFSHNKHNEDAKLECIVCHHFCEDEDGQLIEDEIPDGSECSKCHGNPDDPRNLDLVLTYHKNCKGCHEVKSSGPVVCSECHVK